MRQGADEYEVVFETVAPSPYLPAKLLYSLPLSKAALESSGAFYNSNPETAVSCGPFIVSGVNYDDLLLQLRLNGEVKQKERTNKMIHDVATQVSFLSRHVTLHPGDLIFTGTPGETAEIRPGDVVEVELEGAGVLRNEVIAE